MTNRGFIESIRLNGEVWKDIIGYEGLYAISSLGRIASLRKGLILSPLTLKAKNCRYYSILLHGKGKPVRKLVHRIVAEAFILNPHNFPEVDHINRNGQDNRVENLRWCTRKMNMANEKTKEILSVCHDGHDGSYRWKPVVQLKEGKMIKVYESIIAATRDGFAGNNITQVCRKQKKSHKGYQWMYLLDYEKLKKK